MLEGKKKAKSKQKSVVEILITYFYIEYLNKTK